MTCYVSCVTFNPTHCSVLTPRGDQNTQLHSSVNSTSWKFWSEFCFSCVFWHIVVFMEGSIIPDWVTALNYLRWCSSPLQIGQHVCSARAVNSLLHTRRLSIFMLMPRTTCHLVSDPQHPWLHFVSNSRPCLRGVVWLTGHYHHSALSDLILQHFFVQCPCNSLLWQCHYNYVHSFIHSLIQLLIVLLWKLCPVLIPVGDSSLASTDYSGSRSLLCCCRQGLHLSLVFRFIFT